MPADPERVVVLDSSFLDAALALGVTPVGATEASAGFGKPEYLSARVPDIEVVGLTGEPNLEAIAALRPDLILGAKVRHEKLYDQLARIAPTVFTESSGTNWKEGLDVLFALGAEPVAVRYWFGDTDDVIFSWAEDEAGDAAPEILNMAYGELNYEKIAALRPDLILGVYSGITNKEYETLSAIAPTVAQPDGYLDFGVPWQIAARQAGTAIGRLEQAEELIDELEAKFSQVRDAHPEWAGTQVAVVAYRPDGTGVFASEDPRSRFFTQLGFEVPAAIDELAGEKFYGTLSPERFDVIDGDLIVWDQMTYVENGRAVIVGDPVVAGLQAMKEGRAVYMKGEMEAAFAFNSLLSLGFVLDEIVPLLEAATDGDPATKA